MWWCSVLWWVRWCIYSYNRIHIMGGGLFGTPLALNWKCIVFSGMILTVYWLPRPSSFLHRMVVAFLLANAAYILLAWYDVLFDCNDHLRPTILGWYSKFFKPAEYSREFDALPVKYQKIVRTVDIVVLGVVVAAFVYPFLVKS